MRGSYSGNTLAFQANADSSILLPRSIHIRLLMNYTDETFVKELDLPSIPVELEEECYGRITESYSFFSPNGFTKYSVSDNLEKWLKQNVISKLENYQLSDVISVQTISSSYPITPHVDGAGEVSVFYILDLGGDNVQTSWFLQDGYPLIRDRTVRNINTFDNVKMCFSKKLQPKKWVLLQSNILHNVTNITTLRTSVALRFIEK